MQVPPQKAIFGGYSTDYKYFQKVVLALSPALAGCLQRGPQPYIIYVFEYDCWRRALPKEDYEKAPLLKVIFNGPEPKNEAEVSSNLKFFFSTRWIPAADNSSTWDYPEMSQETDVDRSHRDELIALIQRRNEFTVDQTHLQFESIEYKHPFHDPLTGF
ncbi:hypothetical protein MSAN_02449000 [Mycena sanguinolenta]|uniref:Uncharacterized protein n=1 Tax=Mycena sanguinolenta TaxID=230812 RepID=A0A8H7CAN0_9AGAR|nr:hypothetical protein MSAN_02449000 [Mycena sanguinolenta]